MKKIDIKSVLIGLLIGTNLMFLIGAKQQPDDIVAKSIRINNDDGRGVIYLESSENNGFITTYNFMSKKTAYLGTAEDGVGSIKTYNDNGLITAFLGTGVGSLGFLETFNEDGKRTMYLGTNNFGNGMLNIYNKYEKIAVFVGSSNNDGVIQLYDRYEDAGWGMSGKK